ncbi:2'-5' RNA ligase family protein [filamentous cyanobacterium LEGE 11480]|uniref:2'-5' RNA ligase family protein n=2 Tax=Romeriopsis TaxID=2992131 RepID=A0A928Z3F9_9CYAN|nr:2'-5' RNA ligase family protein [Romeriopsis navalis LEGE 11480]
MQRWFIALLPPIEMQDYANQVRQHFADHYASRKAFNSPPHITLQPPFDWEMARRDALITSLTTFAHTQAPVPVTLPGFGAFPPRVIFIDVVRSCELLALQQQLMQHCVMELNIRHPSPERPFAPHMTVAFRDLTKANFHQAWPKFEHQPLVLTNADNHQYQFAASSITLLQHDGQRWQVDCDLALRCGAR